MRRRTAQRPMAQRRLRVAEGYVWCDKWGVIHEDCLDPYWYGPPEDGFDDMRCTPADHSRVYTRQQE